MPAPCPPEAPFYYTTILHSIAVISAPINLLSLYLVLARSPGISKYKYGICYLQLASFFTELQQSVVCPGYYFFPLLAGYNTGKVFGSLLRSHIYMTMWTFYLASEIPAITWCFIYRHNAAVDMTNSAKKPRIIKKLAFGVSQLFPFAVSFSLYMSEITDEQAHKYLSQKYPQCTFWLNTKLFAIYDWNSNIWIAYCGLGALGFICVFVISGAILGAHTMILLHNFRALMSAQTYRMHRTALVSLTLQVIVPSVLLILPLYTCLYVIAMELVEHQELATNSTILIACHSLGSSLVMITANPRYRKIIRGWVCGPFRRGDGENSMTESSTMYRSKTNQRRRKTIEPESFMHRRSVV